MGAVPPIEALLPGDFQAASALVAQAGWNQVRADWQLFADLGNAFAVRGDAGTLAATAATLQFSGFGWISMVLVDQRHRRKGLATGLLQHCIAHLAAQGLVPVLDATPAGRAVYQPLGFRDGWKITRWRRPAASAGAAAEAVASVDIRPLEPSDWPEIDRLDSAAFGAARGGILRRLHARSPGFACVARRHGQVVGFLLGRDGRQATQVGPVVAVESGVATALLHHALPRIDGPVLLDALDTHAALRDALPAAGFAVERGYTRMALRSDAAFGDAGLMAVIAGPELG